MEISALRNRMQDLRTEAQGLQIGMTGSVINKNSKKGAVIVTRKGWKVNKQLSLYLLYTIFI